jgi:hypothetical protein
VVSWLLCSIICQQRWVYILMATLIDAVTGGWQAS